MSESLWQSDVVEEAEQKEPVAERTEESAADAGALTLSADEFSALEERVMRAVNLVKQERQARAAAEKRVETVEAQLREAAPLADNLQKEVSALRDEREQVRRRVERLLSQLDALEL
jgi:chromosome segregation ATPase